MNNKDITNLKKKEVEIETMLNMLRERKGQVISSIEEHSKQADLYSKTANLLINTALFIQTKTIDKIAQIVTDMYQYVFQTKDEFVIKINTKRSVPVAEFYIKTIKNGEEFLLDPLTSDGGGKVDVISLGLRIASLLLYKPKLEPVILLDEPMRFLSSDETTCKPYRLRAAEFLNHITKVYGIQIIAITHDKELLHFADKIYKISLDDKGYSVVEDINVSY